MSESEKWTVPPELKVYEEYTNYPGRAEELINSTANFDNNIVKAAMGCEVAAQWDLLARLDRAGLLRRPEDREVSG